MRKWWLVFLAIVYLILLNTRHLWDVDMGPWSMLIFLAFIAYFLVLTLIFLGQFFRLLFEGFKNKEQMINLGVLAFVLLFSVVFPNGVLHVEVNRAPSVFLANREGAANCMLTVELFEDSTFAISDVCFGNSFTSGRYRLSRDTVHFTRIDSHRFGRKVSFLLLKKPDQKSPFQAFLYENRADSFPVGLSVRINQLAMPAMSPDQNTLVGPRYDCDFQYDTITNKHYRMHRFILEKYYEPDKRGYFLSDQGDTVNLFVYHQDIAVIIGILRPDENRFYSRLTNKVIYLILENDAVMLSHGIPALKNRKAFQYFFHQIEHPVCNSLPIDSVIKIVRKEFVADRVKDIENKRQIIGSLEKAKWNLEKADQH